MSRFFVLLYALLSVLIVAAIFVGHQQPPSSWAQLFHLSECELPCWIGIVPGKTTVAEAQQIIEETYGDTAIYLLESQDDLHFKIQDKNQGNGLKITLNKESSLDNKDSIIGQLYLLPYIEPNSTSQYPTIADLYNNLENPVAIRLANGSAIFNVALLYEEQDVRVFVNELECEKVFFTQSIGGISIVARVSSLGGEYWFSNSQQWQGFGRCYNFEINSAS